MTLSFVLPPIENGLVPLWTGNGFQIGEKWVPVLSYSTNSLGWNDHLTHFHEETAGEHHFIDCASRDHAILQLKKHIKTNHPTILEVGCSSGYMLQRIQKTFTHGSLIGSDVVNAPLLELAKAMPHVPLIQFDMVHCPLPNQSVDAIVMLNILEHIEKDTEALQQAYRILKPGGVLVIEVPAGPHLYDSYDELLLHYRRYRLTDLSHSAKKLGFILKKSSHLGFFLYPAFAFIKKRNQRLLALSTDAKRKWVKQSIHKTGNNAYLHRIMQMELWLGRLISYPFGIRCLLVCLKPHKDD